MLPSAYGLGQYFQDLGHSFSPYGPPSRQITYIYLFISCLQFCVSLTCYFLHEGMVAYLSMGTYVLQIEVFKVMLGTFFTLLGQQRQGRCQLKKE